MKNLAYIIVIALFLAPFFDFNFAEAGGIVCSSNGYTIATINGIFNDENGAKDNLRALQRISPDSYSGEKVGYQYLYNPSHLAGLGDIAMAAYQKYFEKETVEDYDLVEMLRSASQKITTRKLLLVAHSQGNFYANSFYDTVAGKKGGVPAESIGVYAVATPASRVAGGGKWITSTTDEVIAGLVGHIPDRTIMAPNTTIKLGASDDPLGHAFSDVYLKYRGAEIVAGIESSLDKLKSTPVQDPSLPCISSPTLTLSHGIQGIVLAAADPIANFGASLIGGVGTVVGGTASNIAAAIDGLNKTLVAVPKETQIAVAVPSIAAEVAAKIQNIQTPITEPAVISIATSAPEDPVLVSAPTSTAPIASDVINDIQTASSSIDLSAQTDQQAAPVANPNEDNQGGYVAEPLVYAAAPIPESHEIPSVSGGGGSVDDNIVAVAEDVEDAAVTITDDSSSTIQTSTSTSTVDESTSDNIASSSPVTAPMPIDPAALAADPPVVINEIAWGGTGASPNDQWIELYNRSSQTVDLTGYTLYSKTHASPYITLSGTVPSRGYFLIEAKNPGATDEATQSPVKDITADLWTSFGDHLSATGDNLVLSYSSTTIDQIPFCFNWCGVPSSRTTERRDPDRPGNDSSNWAANDNVITNGINAAGGKIIGTPRARNNLNYLLSLSGVSLTLNKKNSPYLVDSSTQVVSQGTTLTIEPGVVIKFRNSGKLFADGNIVANGTAADPIVFTAFADDSYGGDMDGVGGTPFNGSWFGVELSNKSVSSSFDHTIFRYGGGAIPAKSLLYVNKVSPSITNSVFEFSKVYGLYLEGSNSTTSNNIFRNNTGDPLSAGMYADLGAPQITGNSFANNTLGLGTYSSTATISGNIFSGNNTAMQINSYIPGPIFGNSGAPGDTINILSYISNPGATTTLLSNPMPYFLSGTVTVLANSTLDIKEGTTILNSLNSSASLLNVFGKLNIDTSTTTGVVFASNLNDTARSAWMGIVINSGASAHIRGATIKNAVTGIKYNNGAIDLDNVILSSNTTGIQANSSPAIIKAANVTFTNNGTDKSPSSVF